MTRCFITGSTSYIGQIVADILTPQMPVRLIKLSELAGQSIEEDDIILNAAFRPQDYQTPLEEGFGCDEIASNTASHSGARYIMLSTRAVYPTRLNPPLREDEPTNPPSIYGLNKVRIEQKLRERLGDRLLVLRLSNVFGRESRGRRTFISTALTSLATRNIVELDINPQTRTDFVPIDFVAEAILALIRHQAHGTYNVASGSALPIGAVAEALIEGWKSGQVIVTSEQLGDQFELSTQKLTSLTGLSLSCEDVLEYLRKAAHDHVVQ